MPRARGAGVTDAQSRKSPGDRRPEQGVTWGTDAWSRGAWVTDAQSKGGLGNRLPEHGDAWEAQSRGPKGQMLGAGGLGDRGLEQGDRGYRCPEQGVTWEIDV